MDVYQRWLRMMSFNIVGLLRSQDHWCAVYPPYCNPQHLFGTDRLPFLPPSLLTPNPRSLFPKKSRARDAATNCNWSTVSLFVLHLSPSSPASAPGVPSLMILPRLYDYHPTPLPLSFSPFPRLIYN